ncbi:CesT family type III secretion system chaperone [Pseudomonas fontis]|uniref:CesT family type III secretion system chaperone n=1 Tax=Pseudomonas fontis TaxID=2942633 RepID=A0ABT5NZR8_9PSED|nr:CesT family type III secretion system chaperone [Pseudomonas fontis]MDD0976409.1 CesT family type III secretion system chaperone [Pseudomonas fontis]MDD0993705.1 CesT family type III secretion system chaperone [Pseudomonas fontis]
MKRLLQQLADWLAIEPLVADRQGCYWVPVEGHSLVLVPMGTQLTIRADLAGSIDIASYDGQAALLRALEMVTRWGRQLPQALAISPEGSWVVEARLELNTLEFVELKRVLSAHVGILELVEPLFQASSVKHGRGPSICRP